MIEISCLSAGYPKKPVLQNISLSIPRGKVTALLGPNCCGKTTFLKALCGILPADSGKVLLDGTDLLSLPSKERAQKIAYLAQSRQIPEITVERLVLHGRFPYLGYPRRYRAEDHTAARAAMEQMGILDLADSRLEALSGGQRQKTYIAMALAQNTPIILLDEPTTHLDISHQLQLLQMAKQLARQGKTVVMIIHDLSHAMQTADWLVLMQSGCIVAEGTPEKIYDSGMIDQVFQVKLDRTASEGTWRYYCEERK